MVFRYKCKNDSRSLFELFIAKVGLIPFLLSNYCLSPRATAAALLSPLFVSTSSTIFRQWTYLLLYNLQIEIYLVLLLYRLQKKYFKAQLLLIPQDYHGPHPSYVVSKLHVRFDFKSKFLSIEFYCLPLV